MNLYLNNLLALFRRFGFTGSVKGLGTGDLVLSVFMFFHGMKMETGASLEIELLGFGV